MDTDHLFTEVCDNGSTDAARIEDLGRRNDSRRPSRYPGVATRPRERTGMDQREILFQQRMPRQISPESVQDFISEHGEIVSFGAREGPIDCFTVVFVSKNGTPSLSMVLNPIVARRLCKRLVDLGYGPAD